MDDQIHEPVNEYTDSEIESALTEWFQLSKKDGETVNPTAITNMVRFIKTYINNKKYNNVSS